MKIHHNQKGFSAIEVIVVLIVVALLALGGWYIWQKKDDSPAKSDTTSNNNQNASDSTDNPIMDVNITLETEADIAKLPAVTPASFKSYLQEKLKNNTPDDFGCITQYSVTKISSVNIKGGGATVSAETGVGDCVGGAPNVWVLAPNGTWDYVTLNGPTCKSENGGLVYEEFASECYTDPDADTLVTNPNGSVTSL